MITVIMNKNERKTINVDDLSALNCLGSDIGIKIA
jgi:hypothetical protein